MTLDWLNLSMSFGNNLTKTIVYRVRVTASEPLKVIVIEKIGWLQCSLKVASIGMHEMKCSNISKE